MTDLTREQWLDTATNYFRPMFKEAGAPLPEKIAVHIGFPSTGRTSRRIGECWQPEAAKDQSVNIFLKPTLDGATDSATVLAVLVHELCHAAARQGGHGEAFKRIAVKVGLTGPMRSTAAGDNLRGAIKDLIEVIGPLPHGGLADSYRPRKKDGTRQLKVTCEMCGYVCRTTQKWLDTGTPLCPCNGCAMVRAE